MPLLKRYWPVLICLFLLGIATYLYIAIGKDYADEKYDIYYLFLDGQRTAEGQNTYSRINDSNMRDNDKYTTYFPAFIELSFLTQRGPFRQYENWVHLWRIPFLLSYLAIGGVTFWLFYTRGFTLLGIFSKAFWLFNRWSLYVVQVNGMDFLPILFLLLSLLLLPRNRWLALLMFSLSLALKQIAIFLIPLYLIDTYQKSGKDWLRQVFITGLVIASIPLLTSIPFLIWDAKGFVYSILFSATRSQYQFYQPANSIDMYLKLDGLVARIPMLLMMLIAFLAMWKNKISLMLTSALTMLVFVDFNSIFFSQYMPWFITLLPFSLLDFLTKREIRSE